MIDDVSDTALWVASYRAQETERPDALFRDPFAARLAGEKGRLIAERISGSKLTGWAIVMRTCIIDRFSRPFRTTRSGSPVQGSFTNRPRTRIASSVET